MLQLGHIYAPGTLYNLTNLCCRYIAKSDQTNNNSTNNIHTHTYIHMDPAYNIYTYSIYISDDMKADHLPRKKSFFWLV